MNTHGPYSHLKQAGNLFFVSGQVGIDPANKQAPSDIVGQTRQALENLKSLLHEHGLNINNTVKTTVYLKNIEDFGLMNDIYAKYFNESLPARACVAIADLPKLAQNQLLVEIEAVVCKP